MSSNNNINSAAATNVSIDYTSVNQNEVENETAVSVPPQSKYYSNNNKWVKRSITLVPWLLVLGLVCVVVNSNYGTSTDTTANICAASRQEKLSTKRNVFYDASTFSRVQRYKALNQKGATIWFTGLSGSGKSTVGRELEKQLLSQRKHVYRLDGDNVRIGLNRDLGFSPNDRKESVRRVGEMSALFSDAGTITLVALVSPYKEDRDNVRKLHDEAGIPFIEVFVDVPLSIVQARDTKGLYEKALRGDIKDFTGISAPYEAPVNPEVHLRTSEMSLDKEVDLVMTYLKQSGILVGAPTIPAGYPGVSLPDGGDRNVTASSLASPLLPSSSFPKVLLRDEDLHWVQVLGEGWAAPLTGFMKEGTYLQSLHFGSVLFDSDDLTNGALNTSANTNFSDYTCPTSNGRRISMPVPIVLPINARTKDLIGTSDRVTLVSPAGQDVAVLSGLEIYPHRKEERIARTFGTTDADHPYIKAIQISGEFLLGGEVTLLSKISYNDGLDEYRLSPTELRQKFSELNADAVLAFQTRNPTHAGHAYLMKEGLQMLLDAGYKNPVLWLSPLGGWTKDDDVPLDVRVRQHEAVIQDGTMLDRNSTVLAIWPSPMIYAGPREVQWHAKSRRNAGASFFVVGRDPAGMKHSNGGDDIYAPDHGRYVLHVAPGLEDMSIMSFTKVYYDVTDRKMKPREDERKSDFLSISGSRMRSMARQGLTACEGRITKTWEESPTCVPQGFMVESGWKIVVDYYMNKDSATSTWIPYSKQLVDPILVMDDDSAVTNGTFGLSDYKYYFTKEGAIISPWHDIPLNDDSSYNFIVEIPKGTMAKMEVNKEHSYNPIMQDLTKVSGQPRFYQYGVPFFNYGLFPQTWEDPEVKDKDGNGGDNDPLDVIEVGHAQLPMGSVNPVKVLGCLELVDEGEVDHKIIALSLKDPDASVIDSIEDLRKQKPGIIKQLVDWLKNYKIPEGKAQNYLSQEEPTSKEVALRIIEDTHLRWQALLSRDSNSSFWLPLKR